MKFITRVLAVLFVFAIPMSANAWEYETDVDPMTDETSSQAKIVRVGLQIEENTLQAVTAGVTLVVSCDSADLSVLAALVGGSGRFKEYDNFYITVRFDKNPAFNMAWESLGGRGIDDSWAAGFSADLDRKNHVDKFLKSLRTSESLRLRPVQQSDVYTLNLIGVSTEPLDRVLRDCGRDDLID